MSTNIFILPISQFFQESLCVSVVMRKVDYHGNYHIGEIISFKLLALLVKCTHPHHSYIRSSALFAQRLYSPILNPINDHIDVIRGNTMNPYTYYVVDVFAEEKYAGNQLAVFRNAHSLSDSKMQQIAKEINYSETTFILSDEEQKGGYDVRIFTPENEVPFAGHPTLGTAFILQKEIIKKPIKQVVLTLKVGQIPVTFTYSNETVETLWMKQIEPEFYQTFDSRLISEVLSIEPSKIDDKFPIEEVSTGLPFIIVPLKSLNAVKQARIAKDKYYKLIENTRAKGILVFCPEPYNKENDLNVRVFVDYYGIPEDPATGSANGCLAGYLVKNSYFGKDSINIRVEQGYEIKRPSLLYLKAQKNGGITIYVGGKVIPVARGEFI